MTQILPRFYRHQQAAADHQHITTIVAETTTPEQPATTTRATLSGDNRRLRGIPAIGYGVAGVSPGTDPHGALAAKERQALRHTT